MNTNFFYIVVVCLGIGLFSYGLFNMVDSISRNNGATSNVLDDPQLSSDVDNIGGNLTTYFEDTNSADNSLSNSSIGETSQGDQRVVLESLRGIPDVIRTSPTGMYSTSVGFVKRTLFTDSGTTIIFTVVAGIIALALIIAFVSWFVTGRGGRD